MTGPVWRPPDYPEQHCWPVSLECRQIRLAPFRTRDIAEWSKVRSGSASWLAPWDATAPNSDEFQVTQKQRVRFQQSSARQGTSIPWLIRDAGLPGLPVIGQCTVSNIVYGSAQMASIGYWIARDQAGRGITPLAVAMATDYAMRVVGLHRIEICIRPENAPSLRVVEKLGFREEGLRPRFIHIAGDWRDHRVFALTREELPDGLLARVPPLSGR